MHYKPPEECVQSEYKEASVGFAASATHLDR
jgi:hypothetical protein